MKIYDNFGKDDSITSDVEVTCIGAFDGVHKGHIELINKTKEINKNLPPLKNFVLPGGNKESSLIHISRTVCRRAERSLVEAAKTNKVEKNCLAYLNRLSDFLFVLARKIQRDLGSEETLWSQD